MVKIEDFRKMVLSMENIEELPHFEKTSFRVNKKIVATLDVKTKRVVIKLSDIEQSVFGAYDHTIIYPVKGSWGKQGWTIIELDKVKKTVLKDAVKTSFNNIISTTPTIIVTANGVNKNKKSTENFLALISAPARRALEGAGIKTLKQLSKKSKTEILALHGIGPSAIPILERELKHNNLSFK